MTTTKDRDRKHLISLALELETRAKTGDLRGVSAEKLLDAAKLYRDRAEKR